MYNVIRLYIILTLFCLKAGYAKPQPANSSPVTQNIEQQISSLCDKDMLRYIATFFEATPIEQLNRHKAEMYRAFIKYNIREHTIYEHFIEAVCKRRFDDYSGGVVNLNKAIAEARKINNHYLLYSLYTNLAFFKIGNGNTVQAMNSYRLAQREAAILNDVDRQIIVAINVSDLYYKNNLYKQSLAYLNQAQAMANTISPNNFNHENFIYFNKAEIFFRMKNLDSLKKYHALLHDKARGETGIYVFRKECDYFLTMLRGAYHQAVNEINALKYDDNYPFADADRTYLADAYFKAGMSDSAKNEINGLIASSLKKDDPALKHHLYQMLGQIEYAEGDRAAASEHLLTALHNLQKQNERMVQVANISSQMKIDTIADGFTQKEEYYKRQRILLLFAIIVSVLIIAIVIMFYRNVKQKRYYEKILYTAKQQELSFINSHEVRRHLSNILGLVSLLKNDETTEVETTHIKDNLQYSAERLDHAIKSISEKLDD